MRMARPIRMPMRKQPRTPMRRTIMATMITTITMTSIATTTIITAIPMLMTTSKPPAKPRRSKVVRADTGDKAAALPPVREMDEAETAALYRLMTWLSPAFPVGAFSYSSGIEWAVEAGDIGEAASLKNWLAAMLADGSGFCDGVFLAHAHRAAALRDADALGTSRNLLPPSCPRASVSSRHRRKAAPSSTSPARRGIATASMR